MLYAEITGGRAICAAQFESLRRIFFGRRWTRLHRLVYLAAIGGVVHFLWLVKADLREPLIYGSVLAALLGIRVVHARRSWMPARS